VKLPSFQSFLVDRTALDYRYLWLKGKVEVRSIGVSLSILHTFKVSRRFTFLARRFNR
jgi:hypothetical protein